MQNELQHKQQNYKLTDILESLNHLKCWHRQ